jgi:hypothetical protein
MKGYLAFPVLLILFFGTAASADFQKGLDAYESEDYAAALEEWKPLAELGEADAQFYLGKIFANGLGVTQDYMAAVKWYKLAAEQGKIEAQNNLGFMYAEGNGVAQDNIRAYMWWNIAASQGIKKAAVNLSMVQRKMTPAQIEKAQELTRECIAKEYADCG